MRRSLGMLLVAATVLVARAGAEEVGDFYNVVAPNGADPWVHRHSDGWYYAVYTTGGDVTLRRSRTISALGGGEAIVAWRPLAGTPFSRNLWAPELHFLKGKWYIHVAADDGDNARHRMYVLENPSPDPFEGKFLLKGKVADREADRWAIDGTVLVMGEGDDERLYYVWSGWEGFENVDQRIYIAPMSDPRTISGPRVELSRPTLDWEKAAGPPTINEGPQALQRDGKTFLVYSAAGSWSDFYCLGLLSLEPGADPLDPKSWTKSPRPVFESGDGVVAPGHCSFTKSPDGSQDWIVFHAAKKPGSGWSRSIRAQPFSWGEDGAPAFGRPIPPDRPIPLPAGEPGRLRLEAEAAGLEGRARGFDDPACSGGFKVNLPDSKAVVSFQVEVDDPGVYVASIRYHADPAPGGGPRLSVTVDGRPAAPVSLPDSGERWSNAFARLPLKAGSNVVSLAAEVGLADVDCLDIVLDPLERRRPRR
ncbi:family 43 glycosylhydrolase [Paludisphaera sp.]|uniref:family 43 glycosylhydrolase n=1 Tax=Paludisphaera sp. TaxID=2017432 RepID=UPI00301E3E0E